MGQKHAFYLWPGLQKSTMSAHKNCHFFQLCVAIAYGLALLTDENYPTCAEMHGESCKAYRMKLSPLDQKILMDIQLGVICVNMVDFHRPGHIFCAN